MRKDADKPAVPKVSGGLIADVGAHLFATLKRTEQRAWAEEYVGALLTASGRKTLRTVAAQIDGGASRQSVHHFISSSPWEWLPIRRALARYAHRTLNPRAWVIRPTAILKAGPHSVGVDEQYVPHLGQTVNAQQALEIGRASCRERVFALV